MTRDTASIHHRLDGLEPDNLLAFLGLLGLLRALEARDHATADDGRLRPRAAWDIERPPLRPVVFVAQPIARDDLAECAAEGLAQLAGDYAFGGRKDLDYRKDDARELLKQAVGSSSAHDRTRVDLLAALMTDAAVKETKEDVVDPTPFCLLFGQGHQHFLERAASVPASAAPPARGRGRTAVTLSASQVIAEALFEPWHRTDPTESFRWDPQEDVRYALMAGNPTDRTYKGGTQHGANRLAIAGLPALTIVPEQRAGRIRPSVIGGTFGRSGFTMAWPIWRAPATLGAIRALLAHPDLRAPDALRYLGVDHVLVARRISVGKFMNFSRARRLDHKRDAGE